ncbi:MAG: nitroreductase family protein [Candidatus Bathyarchaeota archaeon]|nr:nitroreductase family protein [Candidatus Bathyarchaeota archaeon]
MDVLEAIQKRRSIRKFKTTPLTSEQINNLLEAARLAPSGCNVQPWRFIVVNDTQLKTKLSEASFDQLFIKDAPVVIVCCSDLHSWKESKEKTQELLNRADINLGEKCEKALMERVEKATADSTHERIPSALLNVAIAIEHIVLTAVELGLGSCWVRLFDEKKVKQILKLPEYVFVVALLPIGIPDEDPPTRPRLPLSKIILQNSIKSD